MMAAIPNDIIQTVTVARNEVTKFLRSRKLAVYLALVTLIVVLMTALPYVLGDGLRESAGAVFSDYIGYVSLLVLLGVTLFASYTIVSEFEERTALILFTRPLRKSSIFFGKFLACYVLVATVIVVYYLASLIITFAVSGVLVTSFLPSLAMSLLYVFATTGVAMFISSFMKKGGTSAVLTFITILLLIAVVSAVMSASGIDTWFMLDGASKSIVASIPEYVESANGMMADIGISMGVDVSDMMVQAADCVKSGVAMFVWGVVTLILSYLVFSRREF